MEMLLTPVSSTFSLPNYCYQKRACFPKASLCFTSTTARLTSYPQGIHRRCNEKPISFAVSAILNNQGHVEKLVDEKHASLENELQSPKPHEHERGSALSHLLHKIKTFYQFCRPYSLIGVSMAILSTSLLPIESLADLSPKFLKGLLQALSLGSVIHVYTVAINQLYDVDIDKVNTHKQDLVPLASGEYLSRHVVAIILVVTLLSISIVFMSKSPGLLCALVANYVFGAAYSVDLPFLRWKRHPLLCMSTSLLWYTLGVQIPYFVHIQNHILGRPDIITKPFVFQTALFCSFTVAGLILKDIPDTDGDRQNGNETISTMFGEKRAFDVGVFILIAQYIAAMIVGASSSFWFGKLVLVLGHFGLAILVWHHSQHTDPTNKSSAQSFYMFMWKLVSVDYVLVHFLR